MIFEKASIDPVRIDTNDCIISTAEGNSYEYSTDDHESFEKLVVDAIKDGRTIVCLIEDGVITEVVG